MELGVSHVQNLSSLAPIVDNIFDKYNKNLVPIRSLSDHDTYFFFFFSLENLPNLPKYYGTDTSYLHKCSIYLLVSDTYRCNMSLFMFITVISMALGKFVKFRKSELCKNSIMTEPLAIACSTHIYSAGLVRYCNCDFYPEIAAISAAMRLIKSQS